MSPFKALKIATIDALKADVGVSAIILGRIYDEIPRDHRGEAVDAVAPYVYLGALTWRRLELGCNPGYDVILTVYAVSTAFGRDEVWELHEAIRRALDLNALALSGGHLMTPFRAMSGGDLNAQSNPKECVVNFSAQISDATPYP